MAAAGRGFGGLDIDHGAMADPLVEVLDAAGNMVAGHDSREVSMADRFTVPGAFEVSSEKLGAPDGVSRGRSPPPGRGAFLPGLSGRRNDAKPWIKATDTLDDPLGVTFKTGDAL